MVDISSETDRGKSVQAIVLGGIVVAMAVVGAMAVVMDQKHTAETAALNARIDANYAALQTGQPVAQPVAVPVSGRAQRTACLDAIDHANAVNRRGDANDSIQASTDMLRVCDNSK